MKAYDLWGVTDTFILEEESGKRILDIKGIYDSCKIVRIYSDQRLEIHAVISAEDEMRAKEKEIMKVSREIASSFKDKTNNINV